jgi:hypothetical protein
VPALLGEELKLPSVATWWCGQNPRAECPRKSRPLVVKPAFRTAFPICKSRRQGRTREAEAAGLNSIPTCSSRRSAWNFPPRRRGKNSPAGPRPVAPAGLSRGDGGGYCVMPGGLTRVSPDSSGRLFPCSAAAAARTPGSVRATPVEETTLLHGDRARTSNCAARATTCRRASRTIFSGSAAIPNAPTPPRACCGARCCGSIPNAPAGAAAAAPLLQTLEVAGPVARHLEKPELRQNAEAFEAELLAAIFDPARPAACADRGPFAAARDARARPHVQRHVARVEPAQRPARHAAASLVMLAGDAVGVLNQTLLGLAAFHGLARENMTRAQAWRFLDMGLRIERAVYLCTLLDATLRSPEAENPSVLEAVLEVVDSSITSARATICCRTSRRCSTSCCSTTKIRARFVPDQAARATF